jgi:hypothetical protein
MKKYYNYLFLSIAGISIVISILSFNKPAATTEFLQVTAIESVVPGGLGRSRLITMSEGGKMDEIKLENFFSMVGINFENIRSNDRIITDKISDLTKQGWELKFTNTGVYGTDSSTGIYITRYLFSRTN